MWVPVAVWQPCELLYTCYLLTYFVLVINIPGKTTDVRLSRVSFYAFNYFHIPRQLLRWYGSPATKRIWRLNERKIAISAFLHNKGRKLKLKLKVEGIFQCACPQTKYCRVPGADVSAACNACTILPAGKCNETKTSRSLPMPAESSLRPNSCRVNSKSAVSLE